MIKMTRPVTMEREETIGTELSSEEIANALTHGIGILLGLVGVPLLMAFGAASGDWNLMLGLAVFSFSLLLVYVTSTIYHSVITRRLKQVFRRLDHISIYFLIAGTHTPFLLYYLPNATGLFFLGILWGMVALGIIYKLFFFGRLEILSVLFYLGMGWMAVFTIPPMLQQMSDTCLYWIIGGGVSYTVGVAFYLWERLPYHHAVWHLFVIGGTFGHYMALLNMVG